MTPDLLVTELSVIELSAVSIVEMRSMFDVLYKKRKKEKKKGKRKKKKKGEQKGEKNVFFFVTSPM